MNLKQTQKKIKKWKKRLDKPEKVCYNKGMKKIKRLSKELNKHLKKYKKNDNIAWQIKPSVL